MLIKRFLAYTIDYIIVGFLVSLVWFIMVISIIHLLHIHVDSIYNDIMFPVNIKFFYITYRIGWFIVFYELLSVSLLSFYSLKHNGLTMGDQILKIKIVSSKYSGLKFCFLRFIMRDLFFFHIFIIVNLIYMLINKKNHITWYDGILGINIVDLS